MINRRTPLLLAALLALTNCQPAPGPDKTLGGAVLGAGWGAGSGAIIGNQISAAGEGAAVGAGFGMVSGAMAGLGYDQMDDTLITQERELSALRVQNESNRQALQTMQRRMDYAATLGSSPTVYQVFFDADETSLKTGAIENLEIIGDALRRDPRAYRIHVVGHSDDTGDPAYNDRLAQARARSVASYLAARGLSLDQIVLLSHGSKRPIASNATPEGRQLNRRVDVYMAPANHSFERSERAEMAMPE